MNIDLKAIRAAAEAAAEGGWVWHEGIPVISKHWNGNNNTIAQVDRGSLAWHEDANSASRESGANARHIATANPTTVIALLDRLEAAEKDTAQLNWLMNLMRLLANQEKAHTAYRPPQQQCSANRTLQLSSYGMRWRAQTNALSSLSARTKLMS